MKRALLVSALALLPLPVQAQVDPSGDEMAFLWMLNRARNNPQRYASENGLGTLLDGVLARPPLAWNGFLNSSARFKSQEMADNDYFAHLSAVTGKWPNLLAREHGYPLHTGLADAANNIESLAAGFPMTALEALKLLIEDAGVVPPGHRYHLLATGPSAAFWAQHRECAIGYGFNASSTYDNYYSVHSGYRNADSAWLTGVVYNDANGNGLYDSGEGLSGVTVSATGPANLMATTNAAGGWSIAVTAGSWAVSCTGGAFSGTSNANATVAGNNVEIDFESGTAAGDVDFGATPPVPQPPGSDDGDDSGGGGGCSGSPNGSAASLLPLAAAFGLLLTARVLARAV